MANDLSAGKFFSIALIICCCPFSPLIAKWTHITDGYLGSVYLDFKTLSKKNNITTVWQLQNFTQKDIQGVQSRRLLVEFNCTDNIRRVIYLSAHSEQMAEGDVKFINGKTSNWEHPLPKSLGAKVFAAVCFEKKTF